MFSARILVAALERARSSLAGLPDGADPKNLTNALGADGVLTIQIPVRDHRPPLTPTLRSQQFNLPTNVSTGGSLAEGEQQLKLTFDLSGYKPDDVTVKVNDNVLKGTPPLRLSRLCTLPCCF